MKLSAMLFPFQGVLADGTLAPEALVETLLAAGIRAIEPMLSNLEATPKPWERVLALCREAGLEIACLDIGANLAVQDAAARAATLRVVERGLAVCEQLGCAIALIAGSRPNEGLSYEEGRRLYAEGLRQCAEMARERGIVATIENFGVYPEFVCRSVHVREVVVAAGAEVKVTWDNGNFLLADEAPMEAYAVLRELIVHTHIKDFALDETGQASLKTPSGKAYKSAWIGQGAGQVAESIAALKRDGYTGWLSLEIGSSALEELQAGADYVRGLWEGAEGS